MLRRIDCDCGAEFQSAHQESLVLEAQQHARAVHGITLSTALVRALARPVDDDRATEVGQ